MSDSMNSVNNDLAYRLGQIQADVKHVLSALTANQKQFGEIEKRLDAVEKFNVRVLTAASIGVPILTFIINYGMRFIGG